MQSGGEEGSAPFLKVDEINEENGQVETLDLPQQEQTHHAESWIDDPEERKGSPPPDDVVDPDKDDSKPAPGRPVVREDQWAPAPQQPPPPAPPQSAEDTEDPTDSLSLLQLKRIVMDMPKKEPTPYAFEYKDNSSFEEETEELFGYTVRERTLLSQLPDVFAASWDPEEAEGSDWCSASLTTRGSYLESLVPILMEESSVPRKMSLQCLLYVALGVWCETAANPTIRAVSQDARSGSRTTKEPRLDPKYENFSLQATMMQNNLELIASRVGSRTIFEAMKASCDSDEPEDDDAEPEPRTDVWASMTLMCLLVDFIWRQGQDTSGREEIGLELLNFLTATIAEMRWEDTGSSPHRLILCLYWKTILCTFGGTQQVNLIKKHIARDDLEPRSSHRQTNITASPLDYHMFRQEITSKYPAFDPPPPLFPFEPNNNSIIPPLQDTIGKPSSGDIGTSGVGPASINGTSSSIFHQPVHISTPAPSPPPSPAGPGGKGIKKQNYQTNQMFPFLYPPLEESSNEIGGKGNTHLQDLLVGRKWQGKDIPTSILEAADLFATRMRATRAMKQLWDERVRFMKYERGYETMKPENMRSRDEDYGKDDSLLDSKALEGLEDDLKSRINTVEEFYGNNLPRLQSMVIVLVKVLLQTVTTLVTQPNIPNGLQNGFTSPEQSKPQANGEAHGVRDESSDSILQNLDTMRSQEVMGKAVSGILLLLLKWFKLSHVLKFEYLTQLLLDSNYIQLLLKLLTHQELDRVVAYKCERKQLNFFSFCASHARTGLSAIPESDDGNDSDDGAAAAPSVSRTRRTTDNSDDITAQSAVRTSLPEVDELGYPMSDGPVQPITDYSWRNFFANINHLRIMQKIVRNKAHRQLLMVQYKASNVLKKSLKVPQSDIRLYTLKIIKGQVPFCHRKWRQGNMRIITAIYLHCKPELRDDWLAGLAAEEEMSEALPLEQALRSLTYWHNLRRYPEAMTGRDSEAARGLLDEEQDFFLRELEQMDALTLGSSAYGDDDEGEEPPEFGSRVDEAGGMQMQGWQ